MTGPSPGDHVQRGRLPDAHHLRPRRLRCFDKDTTPKTGPSLAGFHGAMFALPNAAPGDFTELVDDAPREARRGRPADGAVR